MFVQLLRRLFQRESTPAKKQPRRMRLEPLEERKMLAGMADLLGNLNPSGDSIGNNVSSEPQFTEVNGTAFFVADDGTNGFELWKSDGTASGTILVLDINTGGSSSPYSLANVNGTLFFTADDGVHGNELWKSDGTASGTMLVKDIITGGGHSRPRYQTNVNGTLFFRATNGTPGFELWKSDGTETGTVLVKDINSLGHSYPRYLTNVNGTLFFRSNDGNSGYELWKSDGTTSGTMLVQDIASIGSSNPGNLTNASGTLFFRSNDGTNGYELWKSDGTTSGTMLVKDIASIGSSFPLYLTDVNGTLFFNADDGASGYELWKSNGTASGTMLVQDIASIGNSFPSNLTNVNGTLFFRADDGSSGYELWKSDGTASGTMLVKDIFSGGGGSFLSDFTNVNGTLFFQALDNTNGYEPWKSDGTASGTVLVQDIDSGGSSSFPSYLTNINGTLFFEADDGTNDDEPWALSNKGEIHGQKFHDFNANGVRDAGEPGLNGVRINLFDDQFNLVDSVLTMDMDVDGNMTIDPETERGLYWFTNVLPGDEYTVEEDFRPDVTITAPQFYASLAADFEVPPVVGSDGVGAVWFSLNQTTNELFFSADFDNLTSDTTGFHIHTGVAGANGDIIHDLFAAAGVTAPVTDPVSGTVTLTAGQVTDLLAGNLYVNLHTTTNTTGEIRGQINTGNFHFTDITAGAVIENRDFGNLSLDFGDAPDMLGGPATGNPYPTLLEHDGARHAVSSLFLGATIDPELDGQPNMSATGDDEDGLNDNDGVELTSLIVPGRVATMTVTASAPGLLNAWIDWNGDGDWGDAGEQFFTDVALTAGPNPLTTPTLPKTGATSALTFVRFRFASGGGLTPRGLAADGEVEDYAVHINVALPVSGDWDNDNFDEVAVYLPQDRRFYLDVNANRTWNDTGGGDFVSGVFGLSGDIPISGDWDNDGFDDIGVYRPGTRKFYLDANSNRTWDGALGGDVITLPFGLTGDVPVIGDWNDDNFDDIGVFRPSSRKFYLDANGSRTWNGALGGDIISAAFGRPGDQPVAGDWNADGTDEVGVYRPDNLRFYLDVNGSESWNGAGAGDVITAPFGLEGDQPVIGDWDKNVTDDIAVYRISNRRFYLDDNSNRIWDGVGVGGDDITGPFLPVLLLAADGAIDPASNTPSLSANQLTPIVNTAIDLLSNSGLNASQLDSLSRVHVVVSDLPGARLGQALDNTILIDSNAAGYGWFIDSTPYDNEEFTLGSAGLQAAGDSAASGRMDLLTAVLHELGHVLGLPDDDSGGVMDGSLSVGTRRLR